MTHANACDGASCLHLGLLDLESMIEKEHKPSMQFIDEPNYCIYVALLRVVGAANRFLSNI